MKDLSHLRLHIVLTRYCMLLIKEYCAAYRLSVLTTDGKYSRIQVIKSCLGPVSAQVDCQKWLASCNSRKREYLPVQDRYAVSPVVTITQPRSSYSAGN